MRSRSAVLCTRVLAAGPIPCCPHRVASARVALVGDAAGYLEPFSGEGMSWAVESAAILAGVAADGARGRWDATYGRRYERAWRGRIRRRQRLCRLLAMTLDRPRLTGALHGAARRHPALAGWIARRVGLP